MIEIELPDGSIAEFPDGTPDDKIKAAIQKQFPVRQGMAEDAGRSAVTGVRQGIEAGLGQFGDAAQMQGDMAGWLAGKLGASEGTQQSVAKWGRRFSPTGFLPSTKEIQAGTDPMVKAAGADDLFGHTPQTLAGEYARTVGQFAPAAMVSPGSMGQKVAMAIVPPLASETAGQVARATGYQDYEPYARFAGALAGGVAAAGNPAKSATAQAAEGAPTAEALKQQTDDLYAQLRNAGITYDPQAYGQTVGDMTAALKQAGMRRSLAPKAFDLVDELTAEVAKGAVPDFNDINALSIQIGAAADDAAAAMAKGDRTAGIEGKALSILRDKLDDFETTAPMTSTAGLAQDEVNALRASAKDAALRNIKNRRIEGVLRNAEVYAAGQEAGIRQGLRNLLKSNAGRIFKGAERAALLEVANGRKGLLTLSRFGFDLSSLSGNAAFLPTIGAIATGSQLGTPFGIGLAGAGTAAKFFSPRITEQALETTSGAIRGGGLSAPGAAEALRALELERLARIGVTASSGLQSARQPALAPVR